MTAAEILRDSAAAGVTLKLSATGSIKATGTQAAVSRWLEPIRANKAGIVALLSEDANEKPRTASRWLIHFADREPLEVALSPAVSHAETLASYPEALAAEPIEPGRRQPDALLTARQEGMIRAWLGQIDETDGEIVASVLQQCRHDEDARAYYLDRALDAVTDDFDDRRSCHQCSNLRCGVCIVAEPGGRVPAIRGHTPVAPAMLRRCGGYAP
ncbi:MULTISPECIES: hypothetical protein [unclassified Candidatus Accumulibacter]|jgi:hypothetical protein|uniref:hypothetical protein n=1 Tax=unclassified Candidatus Accumulibacter TaxID=2619054 RepID=UPI0025BBC003|nr:MULTISPECIES: hypothetical protein [unclassified Candidatus Accumulibacter]